MHRADVPALIIAVLAVSALAFGPVGIAAGHEDGSPGHHANELPDKPVTVVEIDRAGDALVRTHLIFDLRSEQQSQAFQKLTRNVTVRQNLRLVMSRRMQQVAGQASNPNATLTTVQVRSNTVGDRGVVSIFVFIEDLAVVDGNRIILDEAFNGYPLEREFRFVAPQGYTFSSVSPDASDDTGRTISYAPGGRLSEFRLVAVEESPLPVRLPGWGWHAISTFAGIALGGAAMYLYQRQSSVLPDRFQRSGENEE